jgi:hypothetical protein
MLRPTTIAAGAAVLGLAASATPLALAQPAAARGDVCFHMSDAGDSKMDGPRTLLIRADGGRIFRIEFAADCNTAETYGVVLHPVDNSGVVCSAIGLDVHARSTGEACVPTSLTRLTPEQAAALPAKVRP